MVFMKKKKAIKVICVVLSLPVLLTVLWIAYICFSINPHIIDESKVVLETKNKEGIHFSVYKPESSLEYNGNNVDRDCYRFFKAKFLGFNSYIIMGSTRTFESGSEKCYNPSGSKYDYSMMANITVSGKIKKYRFNVVPYENGELPYEKKYSFMIDKEGNLLNKSELNEEGIQAYNDAYNELLTIIRTANFVFNF